MRAVRRFLAERLPLGTMIQSFLDEPQPGNVGWMHTLGSVLSFLLLVQFLTGGVLLAFYAGTTDHAWESLRHLVDNDPAGNLVRSLHIWGASFLVVIASLHILRVVFSRAYRRPRELTWVSGLLCFLLILGFSFTGYLLPWDQKGYWATQVGTKMAATAPLVGPVIATLLRGGEELGAYTLSRFLALHVFFLPVLLLFLVGLHLYLVRKHKITSLDSAAGEKRSFPFYPEQMFRDVSISLVIFVLLVLLSLLAPGGLENRADPTDASYDPRPEWYFLAHYELLRFLPGPPVLATVLVPSLIVLLLFLLPALEGRGRRKSLPIFFVVVLFGGLYGTSLFSRIYHSPQEISVSAADLPLPEEGDRGQMDRARNALVKYECVRCHRFGDQGGSVGPDLSQAGWKFSREHLRQQILDPRANNPQTRMPPYEGRITNDDLEALISYLSLML